MDLEDHEDDWLFDSIKKYKKLYMYELQKPVQAADWLTSDSLVVCVSDERSHEILELSLPAQLYVDEENNGLTKDRDFQLLTGGFSDTCMTSLLHLPQTRKVIACIKGDNSVETWQLQSGHACQNITEKVGIISTKKSTCHPSQLCLMDNSQLVFGSHLSGICVADVATSTVISHTQESERNPLISNMIQQNKCVVTCDKTTGHLYSVDPREDVLKVQQMSDTCPDGAVCDTWVLCDGLPTTEQGVIQVSSSGTVCVRDCRNLKQCVKTVKTVKTKLKSSGPGDIQISVCPTNPALMAVTGVSGLVHLYDRSQWEDGDVVTPVFLHEGHMAERDDPSLDITTNIHLWYPWKQDTLLSTSNDGGLHLFKPVL